MKAWLASLGLCVLTGCELIPGVAAQLPSVQYQDAALVQSPSQDMMGAYFCPKVVPNPFGVPGAAATLCQGFFGPAPSEQDMQVAFRMNFLVQNPNQFPIPVAELLTAVTVFPNETRQNLGAACVVFCADGDDSCTGQPGPDACRDSSRDIRSAEDFAQASADLLVAQGVQAALGETPSFRLPEVNAQAESTVAAHFAFGPQPLLQTLEQLARQSVSQLAQGQDVEFTVPYRVEGTLWFDVGSLGRVAVGFGPVDGTFVLPTEQLVPDFTP